ncbi:MAG: hypothetical protein AAGF97_16345 [Planctomycetota bacterium]
MKTNSSVKKAFELGDLDMALALAGQQLAENEDDGQAWEWVGIINSSLSDFEAAVHGFEHASARIPIAPGSQIQLAFAYGKTGRLQLACELIHAVVSEDNVPDELVLYAAATLNNLDRPDLAMNICNRVVHATPSSGQAYYDLGLYAARCGYPSAVVEALARKALELRPQQLTYRLGLATWLAKQYRLADAYELVKQLSVTEINCIKCRCCLGRLIELYTHFDDDRRLPCQELAKDLPDDQSCDC